MRKRVSYFKGIKRRYHYRGIWNGFQVFDDYAHHPNEIKAVLSIIRLKKKKVCIFFQPHKYIRLEKLWDDFIDVFKEYRDIITDLFITQVYGVGEVRNPIYNSENLVNQLNPYIDHVCFLDYNFEHNITLDNYKNYLTVLSQKNKRKTILLTLGAGNMNRLFFEKNMVDKKLPTILTTNKIIEPKL